MKFRKLSDTARMPVYATHGAAGMDLFADIDATILGGGSRLIPTNIAIELPPGYEAQVRPRSGLALKNRITVLNTPGTIDSDYRGGIDVILHNTSFETSFKVKPGDRIAQLVIARYERAELVEAELAETERGAGGFGSTGTGAL